MRGTVNRPMTELCGACGLTFGAHRAGPPDNRCPGHEGRMDWDDGPGTTFEPTGTVGVVPWGHKARKAADSQGASDG